MKLCNISRAPLPKISGKDSEFFLVFKIAKAVSKNWGTFPRGQKGKCLIAASTSSPPVSLRVHYFPSCALFRGRALEKFWDWWFGGHCRARICRFPRNLYKKMVLFPSYTGCGRDGRTNVNFSFLMALTQVRYLGTQNLVSVTACVATFSPQINSHWHGLVLERL